MNRLTQNFTPDAAAVSLTTEGLRAGTHVSTLDGVLPVEFLSAGDRIVTRSGAVRLVAVTSTLILQADVVVISASALGYDRPHLTLYVAPDQRVVIRDWRAQVLFGTSVAAIPAWRLVDGEFVRLTKLPQARLFTLRFDTEEVIYAEGLELACTRATVSA